MRFTKKDWLILLIPFAILLVIYQFLPDIIPIHWNIKGQMDRSASKNFIFILGIVPYLVYLQKKNKNK